MNAIIVSDLHIGSPYFLHGDFERFLANIPEDYELILNGDIIDKPHMKLNPHHRRIIDLIEQVSHSRKVVWVWGNHDIGYKPEGFGRVHFKRRHTIEQKLLIAHGDEFDEIMPRNRTFMKVFNLIHNLRVKLGANPRHVADYAKKWKTFYSVLCKNVMMNAVNCATANDYMAVICGHTHYPEDKVINGIRYINTGAWTEFPASYLLVTTEEMTLKTIDNTPYTRRTDPVTEIALECGYNNPS